MGTGRKKGPGGGGNPLNYTVVGNPQPANPKPNTIWLNTDVKITGHVFSGTEPCRRSNNKNLIIYPFKDTTKTTNGITFTDNRNGTITAKGKATADAYFNISDFGASYELTLEPGTYVLSKSTSASGISLAMIYTYSDLDHGEPFFYVDGGTSSKGITIAKKARAMLMLVIKSGTTVSSITIKPQLEKGSTATSFVKGDATGQVWILTGKSSTAAFNALKKNGIEVYPISAKQRQEDGTIVDVTAKTWKDGQWVDWWNNQLYENGNEFESITGGWISEAVNHPSGGGPHEVTITRNSDSMTIKQESTGGGGIVRTKNKIDLSNIYSLVFTGDILGTINNGYAYIYVWSDIGSNFGKNVVASSAINAINKSDTTITIPVSSLTGSYYIGFALYSVGITVNMKSFIMAE